MVTTVTSQMPYRGTLRGTWTGVVTGESGDAFGLGRYTARQSISVSGTFGAGTITAQGSNDGASWTALTTNGTTAISFTAAGTQNIFERFSFVRPVVTGGAATVNVRVDGSDQHT